MKRASNLHWSNRFAWMALASMGMIGYLLFQVTHMLHLPELPRIIFFGALGVAGLGLALMAFVVQQCFFSLAIADDRFYILVPFRGKVEFRWQEVAQIQLGSFQGQVVSAKIIGANGRKQEFAVLSRPMRESLQEIGAACNKVSP